MAPPAGAIPPTLPPTVEEAYRRKCIQLKQRMNEVEEANDASRTRLARIQRGIEKMRLERAFLLEQLAKRTSTNVEDSEGSPSPPPTPKEKPLRTKRGHRKPSFLNELGDGRAGSTFIPQGPVTMSPSSDAFSHTHPEPNSLPSAPGAPARQLPSTGNGLNHAPPGQPDKIPKTPFELYCIVEKDSFMNKRKHGNDLAEGVFDINQAMAFGWRDLDQVQKQLWNDRFEQVKLGWAKRPKHQLSFPNAVPPRRSTGPAGDEDVEMGDDIESHSGGDGGGFTAVNRP